MNKRHRIAAVLAITAAVALPVLLAARKGSGEAPAGVAQAQPATQRLTLVGRIEPALTATLTAPFDAEVAAMFADEGQEVAAGAVVLRLDTSDLALRLHDAEAERLKAEQAVAQFDHWAHGPEANRASRAVAAAKAQLADSDSKLADAHALLTQGIIAKMEVDGLRLQADAARMAVAAAEEERDYLMARQDSAERRLARQTLANTLARQAALRQLWQQRALTAPFTGIVVKPAAGGDGASAERPLAGRRVARGQPLLALVSATQVKAVVKVDEADLRQLRRGQAVEVTGDAFEGVTLSGTISGIGMQALPGAPDGGAARYEVTAALPALRPDQSKLVRLGMSASLSITTYTNAAAALVPATAIEPIAGKSYVRVVDAPTARPRLVEIKPGRSFAAGVETIGIKPGTMVLSGQ